MCVYMVSASKRQGAPCPGSTCSKSYSARRAIDAICSSQSNQQAPAKRVQARHGEAPSQMVAAEKESVLVEQACATARVTRHRDHHQIVGQGMWLDTAGLDLDRPRGRRDVVGVQDALAPEAIRKARVVGHIVFVRQEHPAHAAEPFDSFHQRPRQTSASRRGRFPRDGRSGSWRRHSCRDDGSRSGGHHRRSPAGSSPRPPRRRRACARCRSMPWGTPRARPVLRALRPGRSAGCGRANSCLPDRRRPAPSSDKCRNRCMFHRQRNCLRRCSSASCRCQPCDR